MKDVPVIVLSHLSPAQRRALVIADNQLAIEAQAGTRKCCGSNWRFCTKRITTSIYSGSTDIELQRLLEAQDAAPGLTDEDAVPDVRPDPVARLGDLFILGNHRVICGDCTQPDVVARLLGDAKPLLLITDPPYGIELDSEWRDRAGLNGCGPAEASLHEAPHRGPHGNHDLRGHARRLVRGFRAVSRVSKSGYVWHASKFTSEVLAGLLRIGFVHHQQIIWDKQRRCSRRTLYWFQHEPCWFVRKKNAPGTERPARTRPSGLAHRRSSSWADRTKRSSTTPRRSPLEADAAADPEPHTAGRELSTTLSSAAEQRLIAAEQTGRVCYGVELDPKYVDVIVRRWQLYTGKAGRARRRRANVR